MLEADIVHVATHASPDLIQFSDGDFLASDLALLNQPRCRVLVLSACEAASLDQVGKSLARDFVARGVNVLASLEKVQDSFCKTFFPEVYRCLLPPDRISGDDLGTAIRRAAGMWHRGQSIATGGADRREAPAPIAGSIDSMPGPSRELGIDADSGATQPARNSVDTFVLFGDPSLRIRLNRE